MRNSKIAKHLFKKPNLPDSQTRQNYTVKTIIYSSEIYSNFLNPIVGGLLCYLKKENNEIADTIIIIKINEVTNDKNIHFPQNIF